MKTLIIGNITFDHFTSEELALFKTDLERKAIIHKVTQTIQFSDYSEVNELIDDAESWIVPEDFKGEIIWEDTKE
jgi:hypothetical protein